MILCLEMETKTIYSKMSRYFKFSKKKKKKKKTTHLKKKKKFDS